MGRTRTGVFAFCSGTEWDNIGQINNIIVTADVKLSAVILRSTPAGGGAMERIGVLKVVTERSNVTGPAGGPL
jgi:hypothetical protein